MLVMNFMLFVFSLQFRLFQSFQSTYNDIKYQTKGDSPYIYQNQPNNTENHSIMHIITIIYQYELNEPNIAINEHKHDINGPNIGTNTWHKCRGSHTFERCYQRIGVPPRPSRGRGGHTSRE